ncbi:MAG: FecR domain-containing protein [Candidatus Cloacimonetes bacterium]|nr:FecR domain-containing protein [Candidatus Cloacimonadota bacterium]
MLSSKGALMIAKRKYFVLFFIFTFVTMTVLQAQEDMAHAEIMNLQGEVILNHDHQLAPATKGDKLFDGDMLLTKDNSFAIVKFSDNGAISKVFSNSTLTINMSQREQSFMKTLTLDVGKIWSEVTTGEGDYYIQTPTSVAAVKGTGFMTDVDAQTGFTTLQVFEGTVDFSNEFGRISIPAGNQGFSNGIDPPSFQMMENVQPPESLMEVTIPEETKPETPKQPDQPQEQPQQKPDIEVQPVEEPKEEAKADQPKAPRKSILPGTLGIGTVTIDGVTYTRIRLMPEIPIWKFKLGLDFDILIDGDGNIRKKDWDNFNAYLNKIMYLEFANRRDPFYFRLGAFPSVKFGHGLIMRDYTNMLDYPATKQLGAEIAVNTKPFGLGVDVFCPNVDEHNIFAARVKLNPFVTTGIPFLNNLEFGFTGVTDLNELGGLKDNDEDGYPNIFDDYPDNPHYWADTDSDGWPDPANIDSVGSVTIDIDADNNNELDVNQVIPGWDNLADYLKSVYKLGKKESVTIIGADYTLPLINSKLFSLYHYSELAHILDYGTGVIFPGFGAKFLIFDATLDYRMFGDDFEPNFFDYLYDNERAMVVGDSVVTKRSTLKGINKSQGWRGQLVSHIFNILDFTVAYEDIHGKDYNMGKSILGEARLKKTFIPGLDYAYARYSQTQVEKFTTWKSPNAVIEAQIGYEVSPVTLLVWDYKVYYIDLNGDGKISGDDETKKTYSFGVQIKI